MIPYADLGAQYERVKDELHEAVLAALDSRQYILGDFVASFERDFAAYCGTEYAVAVNSGTSALHLALLAAGVQPGDEVITVPFTFIATVAAICYCGATPVLIDVDPRTFNMNADLLERAITSRTKAILPVHLYGQTADMGPIREIALRHGIPVIEDAAQAHGAEYKGRRAGSLGNIGCFSFYPTKNLGACGEGGMLTTSNPGTARTLRMLRDWGQDRKYHHVLRGFNYRMEGLQGAVLGVKLKHLEEWTEGRRRAAALYDRHLEGAPVTRPEASPYARHVYHTYTIRTSRSRDTLQAALKSEGIQTAVHYHLPVHLQPAYAGLGYSKGDLPESEQAAAEVLSLPMYPELSEEAIETIAHAIRLNLE